MKYAFLPCALASLLSVLAVQETGAKPRLERYRTNDETVAFLVTATNTTEQSLWVGTDGRCHARVDGAVVKFTSPGGSGSGRTVAPGDRWQELVRLVPGSTVPPGRRPPNPDPTHIVGNLRLPVQLAAGTHLIAFNCGADWSDDLAFEWKGMASEPLR